MKSMKSVVTIFLVIILLITNTNLAFSQSIGTEGGIEQTGSSDVQVVRVYYKAIEDIALLIPFDLFEYNNLEEKYVLVAVSPQELEEIEKLGFKVLIDNEETANFRLLWFNQDNQLATIPGYSCYRTVEETFAAAATLAANHPNLATWTDAGDSWQKAIGPLEGYDMMVLKLTNEAIVAQKPVLFITAAIHAREYATAEIAIRFAEYLVNNYGIDPDVTWMLDYQEIHIMFHANPDGRKIAEGGVSWRKNRDNDDGCSTTYGVDLNRNFAYQWGTGGSSTNPCDETYRGPSAGSEPETQAIQDYISSVFIDQRSTGAAPADAQGVYIDLHSSGGYVMWPWGYTTTTPPNNAQLQTMGRKLTYFNGYTPGQITRVLYVASGGGVDYAYGEMGVASYAFEVGTAFFESCTSFTNTVYPANLNALLYAAKVARTPYMTPLGPDSLNLVLSASTVPVGSLVTLTATANDTRYKSGTGEPIQAIAAAEYYIDTPPWAAGATANPMSASDGTFNSTTENLTTSVNTAGWNQGRHTLYLRSQDAAGNWGAVSAVFLSVEVTDNEPPVADDKVISTAEDAPVSVVLTGSDPDGDPITFSVIDQPMYGSLSGTAPDLTYIPSSNYYGTDSFTFKVNDGIADSEPATVSITIDPVNDSPIANAQSVDTNENTAVGITLTGSDVDGDELIFVVATPPTNGTLSGNAPNLTYTPAMGFSGADSFEFTVTDGQAISVPATVTITISAVNDNPTADDQSVVTDEDIPVAINLTGSDPEGEALSYVVLGQPTNGSLSGAAPNVTYTPDADFNGSDSFSFKVNDGELDSNTATVSITVNPVNDAPVAYSQSIETDEDISVGITLSGADMDGDGLTYTVQAPPSHGTLSGTAPNLTYTPAANYNGSDSFTFKVNDGTVDSSPATVSITVTAVNDAPVATAQSVTTAEDTAKAITLSGTDVDGDGLTYTVQTSPLHGTLSGTAPNLTYTPAANYNGSDSFTFKVNDGLADSNIAIVSITVTAVNDAPVAIDQEVSTSENTPVEIILTGTDVEESTLIFSIQTAPAHGTITGSGASRVYTPAAGYEGEDSFTFVANDGDLDSEPATVSITVTRTNAPPVADPRTLTTDEDSALEVTLTGSDPDGDPITFELVGNPSHGTLSGAAPDLTYNPHENYNGSDSFSFVVNDGLTDSEEATVTIAVVPVNDAPVVETQSVTIVEDTPKSITLSGTDIDGDPLTYNIVTQPLHGSLSGSAPNVTYTPVANYNGSDSFTFKVNDGTIDSNTATVTITITSVNDAPIADDQDVSTAEDTAKAIVITGSDVDGNLLTYSIVTQPIHGTLSGSVPNVTYTPEANFNGIDSFTFKVNDGIVDSNIATVTVTVTAVNDTPVAVPQSKIVVEDTATEITLTGTDVDGDELTFEVEDAPVYGSLSGTAPNLTYTPGLNYNGPDSFTFKVFDGSSYSEEATISITVMAVNDAPVADAQSVSLTEDSSVAIVLTGSDIEGSSLSFTIQTQPTHGSLSGSGANQTYTPIANYNGDDSFTFVVNDGQTNSVPATVSITVIAVNDAPIALAQTLSVDEDETLNVVLTGSDVDGDGLTFTLVSGPSHGSLSGSIPNLLYTPDTNYHGSDAFTFNVNDGVLISDTAVISITVRPVNDLPLAEGQAVQTNENTPVNITLVGTDIDGDTLTYSIDVAPLHGKLTGTLPNLVYTPDDYYSGVDVFSFYVNDGYGNSNSAEVTILILDINYLPIVYNQTVSTSENSPLAIILAGMDPDGDPLNFFTKSTPAHGVLSGTSPNLVYTPNPGYTGSDSFTFAASDQEGESNEGVISIQITPSGPLTVFFDDFETNLGWVRNAYGTDTASLGWFERADPESVYYNGDKQLGTTVSGSYDLVTGPLAGSSPGVYDLDGGNTSMLSPTIELPTGRDLEISFSYYVSHYTNSSTADYLRVYIIGENTIKIFEELGGNNDDDAVWEIFNGNISSFAGQIIQILIEAADAGTPSYFEAAVDDMLIVATTPNNPPLAESQSHEMEEDTNLELTLAGSDPDGDEISFIIETPPSHGALSGQAPELTYTPYANYNGFDSFSFIVSDGKLNSEEATISIDVTPVNDTPIALGQIVSTPVDVRLDILLSGTDVDGDVLQFNISSFPSRGTLAGFIPNLVYTPDEGFVGDDSFTFVVFDGIEESFPATVNIQVNPAGPVTVFWDDFETNQGWIIDPFNADTATAGTWERADPETVSYYGYKQLGTTVSGSYDLVTGPLAGSSAGDYDLDGGLTTVRSPSITLPSGRDLTLSFSYYFAHANNSSSSDYLRVRIVGSTTTTVFQELGANNDDDAYWQTFSVNLNSYAGQTVYLLIEAADVSTASLVEAAIDDVLIIAE
jgi:hypothetical protein